jgi:predicted alpha/beta hydrolase family esterase
MHIYLIHGWSGNPENAWFPWLKEKLIEKGFSVSALEMPDPDHPKIEPWVKTLEENIDLNEKNILVGHSIGCQTIMRYLEKIDKPVEKIILVAPFFSLIGTENYTDEEKETAKPWLLTPIDTEKVKQNTKEIVAVFSDNDPVVDLTQKDIFESRLGAKIIVERSKGHFSDDADIVELESVLNEIII